MHPLIQRDTSKRTTNWKSIAVFYLIAFSLSAPFNSGYFAEWHQKLTVGTIIYKSSFLFAGLGTLIAALLAFKTDKRLRKNVTTFLGDAKLKNIIIAIIPIISLTVVGIENELNINSHFYAFQISVVLMIYAFTEEIFWRGYLINALSPLSKIWGYLILGILWWAWHFPFLRVGGCSIFLITILVSSFLIGKFVKGTKSYLTAAGLHSLIVIAQHGNNDKPLLYAGAATVIIWVMLDKLWKVDGGVLQADLLSHK